MNATAAPDATATVITVEPTILQTTLSAISVPGGKPAEETTNSLSELSGTTWPKIGGCVILLMMIAWLAKSIDPAVGSASYRGAAFIILGAIAGIAWYFAVTFWEALGLVIVAWALFAIIRAAASTLSTKAAAAARLRNLLAKYSEEDVQRILAGEIWTGMTREQLIDGHGQPVDVDDEVGNLGRVEVLKFMQDGGDRFRLRVKITNGSVIGWQTRGITG